MPNNILITPGSASIQFSGSATNTVRLQVEASGSVAFYGNSGSLFSIVDQLSGSLMSVNDVSGLPILEVFSDDRVVMGTLNQNTLVVTGSRVGIRKGTPTADVDVSGSVVITGSLNMNSGGITGSLFGTASVALNGTKTLAVFTPLDNQPPATNFATLDTRNSIAVLDFDAATDESAVFVGVVPEGAILSGGLQVRLSWAATSATSGVCVWQVAFEKTTGHDIDSDSFDTAVTGSTTTNAASGFINTTSITITTIDSIVAGDTFRLRVTRDADAGADTMTDDAELVAVEVRAV